MLRASFAAAGAIVVAGWSTGCLTTPVHRCLDDADCAGGTCRTLDVPGTDERRCAGADFGCASGLRWAGDAGDLGGSCVEPYAPAWSACLVHAEVDVDEACAREACAREPRCCAGEWSDTCVALADRVCGTACGAVVAVGGEFAGASYLSVAEWNGTEYLERWLAPTPYPGDIFAAVEWGDFDGDREPDLATCRIGATATTLEIWRGDGAGFAVVYTGTAGTALCRDIDWVDVDADGDVDVVAAAAYSAIVIENTGAGFAEPSSVSGLEMGFLEEIDWADLDADGRLDAVVSRYTDDFIVERNTGAGFEVVYDPAAMLPVDRDYRDVAWGDGNGDGRLDVLLAGNDMLQIVANTADGGFAAGEMLVDRRGELVGSAAWVDFDGDGDLDVVALGLGGAAISVLRNDGGVFATTWTSDDLVFDASALDGRVVVADVDGDRDVDLVACAEGDDCRAWRGDGVGEFSAAWDPPTDRSLIGVAVTGRRR